jgi:hypothetical protein
MRLILGRARYRDVCNRLCHGTAELQKLVAAKCLDGAITDP